MSGATAQSKKQTNTSQDASTPKAGAKPATQTKKKPPAGNKEIDRQLLKGRKATDTQELAFPRYPDEEVPETVKEACCEIALALLERGNSQRRKLQQEGVQSFVLGNMSETYTAGAGKGLLSQEAKELLRPWLLGSVNII